MLSDSQLLSKTVNLRSTSDLVEHFRSRTQPVFFGAFHHPKMTIAEFQKHWPESATEIVERANQIVRGSFDLLGFRDLSFGTPPDWHLEPIAGKRSPLVHWSRVDYMAAEKI
jgi:hypothetical protein